MSLASIQQDVDKWTGLYTPQYWPPHEQLARLTEEVGELAREINHLYGTKKKKESEDVRAIEDELTDILFTVVCLANSHKIDLDRSWVKMKEEKLYGRDAARYVKKSNKDVTTN